MSQLFIFTLCLLPWIPALLCKVTTETEFTALEGQSLTIPCHYEPQYVSYVKYWCHGRVKEFCTSLARSDDTRMINPAEEKVSIFDDPVQLVFTVTLNNLKEEDSGWYICGVEIGGIWSSDDIVFTNVKVVHGMSAVNSRLSGEEGSSLTVECLYSERYRESEKKWCRSGDWRSCLSTGSEGRYEDFSVAIRDDRIRAFTITFKKLHMKDTAWYWCSAGQQKITVHVLVTQRPTTTTLAGTSSPEPNPSLVHIPPPEPITKDSWNNQSLMLISLSVCLSVIVIFALILLVRKLWKVHVKDPLITRMSAKYSGYSTDAADLQNATVFFHNKDSQDEH